MSSFLTRDQIFAVPDIQTEAVFVPAWNGTVNVKGMSAAERDAFEASTTIQKGNSIELNRKNFRAKLVALTVVDDDGNRIFADTDIKALGEKSAQALDLLFAAASRLSGISKQDEDDLVKNSGSDLNADSSSD